MTTTPSALDVVGIGNAIVDVLSESDDAFLESQSLTKGTMALVDEQQAESLYGAMGPGVETSGGSVANTMAAIAQLGGSAGFIGRVRNDQLGSIFAHDLRATGCLFDTPPVQSGPSTARCMILVTPDAQRTMNTFLGASVHLDPNDIDLSMVRRAKVLYLEGYLWDSEEAKRAFVAAASEVKVQGGQVALSLSDPFCVDRHRDSFLELVENHVDILFANEAEIISLYQASSFEAAAQLVRQHCRLACLTRSEQGSWVLEGETTHAIAPFQLGELRDTTGAGDTYAAGFLFGYTQGLPADQCGQIASLCAGQVVTQMGPRPQVSLKALVQQHLPALDVAA